jgi:hypothetical protein
MAEAVKIHKIKWVSPLVVYALAVLMNADIVESTLILLAYYLGSWSSESLLSSIVSSYLNALKESGINARVGKDAKLYRDEKVARRKRKIGFWVEYTNEEVKDKGKKLIESMGGKVVKDYPNIKYFYAEFPLKDILREQGIVNSLVTSGIFRHVERDEKLNFFGFEEFKIREEDILYPDDYLRLTEAEKLRQEGLTGKGVKIGVIDSGVNLEQFKNYKVKQVGRSISDRLGHGTAVMDILTHIAPDAEYYIGKATNAENLIDVGKAIDLMEKMKKQGVDIINLSFGGLDADNGEHPLSKEADVLAKNGILVVCAVGNNAIGVVSYPASAEHVIAVGSVDRNGNVSEFSNYGVTSSGLKPEVLSYGEYIAVTKKDMQIAVSGTSFSAPMVAGVLALLKEKYKYPEMVKQALFKTAYKKKARFRAKLDALYCRVMKTIGINLEYLGIMADEMKRWGRYGIVRSYHALLYLKNILGQGV